MADESSISFWWILLFVVLTLGFAAWAILFVGGEILMLGHGIVGLLPHGGIRFEVDGGIAN